MLNGKRARRIFMTRRIPLVCAGNLYSILYDNENIERLIQGNLWEWSTPNAGVAVTTGSRIIFMRASEQWNSIPWSEIPYRSNRGSGIRSSGRDHHQA